MKLAFVFTPWTVPRPIDPRALLESGRGLTGSEISFFEYARQMVARGHDVAVFTNLTADGVARLRDVDVPCFQYRSFEGRAGEGWDSVLAWIDPRPLKFCNDRVFRLLNQQINDFAYAPGWESSVDLVTSPSKTHRDYLSTMTKFQHWEVLPNGVDPSAFCSDSSAPRRPEILWASSPDRGLHLLLEAYPEIRRRVPGVALTICYQWDSLYASLKDVSPGHADVSTVACRVRYIHEALRRFAGHGVDHRKSASRSDVARLMRQARVLAYTCSPVSFTEGFSVTTLEAAVSGCVPLITRADALGEIYADYVPTVGMPFEQHRSEYVGRLVRLLTDDAVWAQASARCRELAGVYNWDVLGDRLDAILRARVRGRQVA